MGEAGGKLAEDCGQGEGAGSLVPAPLHLGLGVGVVANYEWAILTTQTSCQLCFLSGEGGRDRGERGRR